MKPLAKNVFLPAVILFVIANLGLLALLPSSAPSSSLSSNPSNLSSNLSSTNSNSGLMAQQIKDLNWWTISHYSDLVRPPNIVLIGSSLMAKVSNEGDATYFGHKLDARTHHRSQYLEDLLAAQASAPPYCASLSIPGMNASDVSVTAATLLKPPRKPDLVVYGIAPRDLMDNLLPMACQTSIYHLLEKTSDLSSVQYDARIGLESRFKFIVNSALRFVFPLYRYQEEMALACRRLCRREVHHMQGPDCPERQVSTVEKALHLVPEELDDPVYSLPYDARDHEHDDLSNCYIVSYNPFRKVLYQSQVQFFSRFLDTCRAREIKVLLVNMPLRTDSLNLMPEGFYQRYLNDVKSLAEAKSAVFLDFQKDQSFVNEDFVDQVHLNGSGACKFIRSLARAVLDRKLLRSANETLSVAARKPTVAQ